MRRARYVGSLDLSQDELACLVAAGIFALTQPKEILETQECSHLTQLKEAVVKVAKFLAMDVEFLFSFAGACGEVERAAVRIGGLVMEEGP